MLVCLSLLQPPDGRGSRGRVPRAALHRQRDDQLVGPSQRQRAQTPALLTGRHPRQLQVSDSNGQQTQHTDTQYMGASHEIQQINWLL